MANVTQLPITLNDKTIEKLIGFIYVMDLDR